MAMAGHSHRHITKDNLYLYCISSHNVYAFETWLSRSLTAAARRAAPRYAAQSSSVVGAMPRAPLVQQQQQQLQLVQAPQVVAQVAAPQQMVPAWTAVVSRLFGTFRPNKSHSGAKKRFRRKGDGSYKFLGAGRRHKMHKKNRKHTREKGLVVAMDHTHPHYNQLRRTLRE
ncbi:Hypothetical Protein FCC1311_070032 [Hondaea fermentalgiana]|uniref:50S ribosomal protein L35 n=1 Tax=Hondaea fermentalgiana TaxID=2315210 RepID=A0A2R5GQ83_9STRA|nr:Hypothetical Protein FCC1311_070032 [Hondaea fermentalgiana]|eukprot:GBG30783.1 Hypothetical Protein FCC1311_070032 [Hondaea fermentalgiana]